MLIIALPHSVNAASHGYAHVHSDGLSVLRHATGAAATLSSYAGEVVAVVPYSRISWFPLQLPPASHGARLTRVLHGLLEDRLLDDPAQLHIALPPHAEAMARTGGDLQVAVCDKAWLRQALAPLQHAGLVVQRIVPEFCPSQTPLLHVMGDPNHSQSVLSHAKGVLHLPPNTAQWHAFAEVNQADLQIYAEPAMVARVQSTLQRQPILQSAAQRWVSSSQSTWDLAQGEWAQGPLQVLQRRAQSAWQTLLHAPHWRSVRWGLVLLALIQVVGLNAVAWRQNSAAPALHKSSVDASATDFDALLAALGPLLPAGQLPTQIHYENRALRVHGVTLEPTDATQAALKAQGLRVQSDSKDIWVLQAELTK